MTCTYIHSLFYLLLYTLYEQFSDSFYFYFCYGYRRYNQFECFERLVEFYETEPDNKAIQMTLMQEMQEYGQPPIEIIKEIAPEMDLDEDGNPKIDGSLPFLQEGGDCPMM
jgi:hypothetical protein